MDVERIKTGLVEDLKNLLDNVTSRRSKRAAFIRHLLDEFIDCPSYKKQISVEAALATFRDRYGE